MDGKTLSLTLRVWRQDGPTAKGRFEEHKVDGVSVDVSFLEMLDLMNERLVAEAKEPVAFDHDCREGICGTCGVVIDGQAHGPEKGTTVCQLHMRKLSDGAVITVEPWRARAFPVVKDLVVDRTALDRIQMAGGYISTNVGSAPDGNALPVGKDAAEAAFDAAACIGCGACVASCKNASASLFVAAKISHLGLLPQGQAERRHRALRMIAQMDEEGFGACTNTLECEAACPKEISTRFIARMNRDYIMAAVREED
jgi:succinate dehydrogenase / fumarate reductase, iron-sulfur subunit